MLAGALNIQAQTGKSDINTLAKLYAKSNGKATLEIPSPEKVLITECDHGFTIEVKGKEEHGGKDYDIKITHIIKGSSESSISLAGIKDNDFEKAYFLWTQTKLYLQKSHCRTAYL